MMMLFTIEAVQPAGPRERKDVVWIWDVIAEDRQAALAYMAPHFKGCTLTVVEEELITGPTRVRQSLTRRAKSKPPGETREELVDRLYRSSAGS
jgi:hypothetical protein